jgi:hypothetical protein
VGTVFLTFSLIVIRKSNMRDRSHNQTSSSSKDTASVERANPFKVHLQSAE